MWKNQWSDKSLLKALTGTAAEREQAMRAIVNNSDWQNLVSTHVTRHGGSAEDAEDVFQEVIILLDRNIRDGKFDGKSTLKTYFFAIAKWHWIGQKRKKHPHDPIPPTYEKTDEETIEARYIKEERKNYLYKKLEEIGARCKQILEYYQLSYSMAEIADLMQLSSADMAKKETYRCRVKLRDLLNTDPHWKNLA